MQNSNAGGPLAPLVRSLAAHPDTATANVIRAELPAALDFRLLSLRVEMLETIARAIAPNTIAKGSGRLDGHPRRILAERLEEVRVALALQRPKPTIQFVAPGRTNEVGPIVGDWTHPIDEALGDRGYLVEWIRPPIARADAHVVLGRLGLFDRRIATRLVQAAEQVDSALARELRFAAEAAFAAFGVHEDDHETIVPYPRELAGEPSDAALAILGAADWGIPIRGWLELDLAHLAGRFVINPALAASTVHGLVARFSRQEPTRASLVVSMARRMSQFSTHPDVGFALDLAAATLAGRENRPQETLDLLVPWLRDRPTGLDVGMLARALGQAGAATEKLADPEQALRYYRENLDLVERAFGPDPLKIDKVRTELFHKLGRLIRAFPELEFQSDRSAESYLRESLEGHIRLGKTRGVSMCWTTLGQLFRDRAEWAEAENCFARAIANDQDNNSQSGMASGNHQLAIVCERRGAFDEAIAYLERAEALNEQAQVSVSHQLEVSNTRRRIFNRKLGNTTDLEEGRRHIEACRTDGSPPALARAIREHARALVSAQRSHDAVALLEAETDRFQAGPTRNELLLTWVGVLLDLRRHDEAERVLERVNFDRMSPRVRQFEIRLAVQRGDPNVVARIDAALAEDSMAALGTWLRLSRAHVHAERGDFAMAIEDAQATLDSMADGQTMAIGISSARRIVARSSLQIGDLDRVEAIYKPVLQRDPPAPEADRRDAYRFLGERELRAGHLDDAIAYFESSVGVRRDSAALRRLATAYLRAGRTEEALEHARECVELLTNDAPALQRGWAWWLFARAAHGAGLQSEFGTALNEAFTAATEAAAPPLDAALARLAAGDLSSSDDSYLEGLDPKSSSGAELRNLAQALRGRGRSDEALELIVRADQTNLEPYERIALAVQAAAIAIDLEQFDTAEAQLQQVRLMLSGGRVPPVPLFLAAKLQWKRGDAESALEAAQGIADDARFDKNTHLWVSAVHLIGSIRKQRGEHEAQLALYEDAAAELRERGMEINSIRFALLACETLDGAGRAPEADAVRAEVVDRLEQIPRALVPRDIVLSLARTGIAQFKRRDQLPQALPYLEGEIEAARKFSDGYLVHALTEERSRVEASMPRSSNADTDKGEGSRFVRQRIRVRNESRELQQGERHGEALVLAESEYRRLAKERTTEAAIATNEYARALRRAQRLDDAERMARESIERQGELNMVKGLPIAHYTLSQILLARQNREGARHEAKIAMGLNESIGDQRGVRLCAQMLAAIDGGNVVRPSDWKSLLRGAHQARRERDWRTHWNLLEQASAAAESSAVPFGIASVKGAMGISKLKTGRVGESIDLLREAYEIHARLNSRHEASVGLHLGRALRRDGQWKDAGEILRSLHARRPNPEYADAIARELTSLTEEPGVGSGEDRPE